MKVKGGAMKMYRGKGKKRVKSKLGDFLFEPNPVYFALRKRIAKRRKG